MADARHFAQLLERQPVHFVAEIEPEVRHPLLLRRRLRLAVALLLDGGEDGFRIHGASTA